MASRRSVLIGLGGVVAGGGALIGTGAFTTVEAQRTVSVQTAGDASAFLGLEAADRPDNSTSAPTDSAGANQDEYVSGGGDSPIQINLDGNSEGAAGLNQDAKTTFRNLVAVTNNGTQDINSITLKIEPDAGSFSDEPFGVTVDDDGTPITVDNADEILGATGNNSNDPTSTALTPGGTIDFGMVIDLINGSFPQDGGSEVTNYTLTITAETADSQ